MAQLLTQKMPLATAPWMRLGFRCDILLVLNGCLLELLGCVVGTVLLLLQLRLSGRAAVDALVLLSRLASRVCAAVCRALVLLCLKALDLLLCFGDVLRLR
jgi:hypothetical protein